MSKQNKANKNNYNQAGRLTPDEMARERMKQAGVSGRPRSDEHVTGFVRPSGAGRARDEDSVSETTRSGEREPSRPRSEREEAE
jgi:hypothetical protein